MNKIKLNFNTKQNKIIKLGKDRIEIKPYISSKDILSINTLCLKQFNNMTDLAETFTTIKYIFDMFVIHQCTNIEVEGISLNENGGKSNIEIDITAKNIEAFDSSRIMEKIAPHISNYEEVYEGVKFIINLQNMQNAFNNMGSALPDIDKMGDVLGDSLKSLSEFKEKDPDTFNKIIKQTATKDAVEQGRAEFKETKRTKKTEKLANK